MVDLDFRNTTNLADTPLEALCRDGMAGWAVGKVTVRIRYSRGADFSGSCYYQTRRIFVNVGRHVRFPYRIGTHIARARTVGRSWSKPIYTLELGSGSELAWFVFLHELYHLLVKKSRRNTRQKESMCDRFAARHLVDRFGAVVRCDKGKPVTRGEWDFQDLDGFVAAAADRRYSSRPPPRRSLAPTVESGGQLLLWTA